MNSYPHEIFLISSSVKNNDNFKKGVSAGYKKKISLKE
jgi:hypothetical protein